MSFIESSFFIFITDDGAVTGDGAITGDEVVTGDGALTGDGPVTGDGESNIGCDIFVELNIVFVELNVEILDIVFTEFKFVLITPFCISGLTMHEYILTEYKGCAFIELVIPQSSSQLAMFTFSAKNI
mgnify:CR=1 FL=1